MDDAMVSFVGWKQLDLSAPQDTHARTVIDRRISRLHVLTDDVIDARIYVKGAEKYGRLSRFEVKLTVLCASGPIYAHAAGWNVMDAIHHVFESAENQIKHRFTHERKHEVMV